MSTALPSDAVCSMDVGYKEPLAATSVDSQGSFQLLQLPETPLDLVLQKLDPFSLASTAATCSKLRHVFTAYVKELDVRSSSSSALERMVSRLGQHSTSLTHLSLYGARIPGCDIFSLRYLPCSCLRQLSLADLELQLEPSDESPGVLQDCTGLTALALEGCEVQDLHAASAAIAALPELQHLRLHYLDNSDGPQFPKFQHPLKLTYLSISFDIYSTSKYLAHISHLSALVNLQHLQLSGLTRPGCPGGLPSQLVKLTCLGVRYVTSHDDKQFQHVSCLTALKEFAVSSPWWILRVALPDVQRLSQLTSMELDMACMQLTQKPLLRRPWGRWACRTALQSLTLKVHSVHPKVLTAFTQLRMLALHQARPEGDATPEDLLRAVSQLTLLTELRWHARWHQRGPDEPEMEPPSPAAFTALTASSNLCSLELSWRSSDVPHSPVLFQHGSVHPHLRHIDLSGAQAADSACTPISVELLQHLCSCYTALNSLAFALSHDPTPTAWLPLLQLSALTRLDVYQVVQQQQRQWVLQRS